MINKRMVQILSLVVVLSMIFTTAAFASPKNKRFEHFDKKYEIKMEEYEDALKELINKKIVKGYGNGDYGLSGNVKRGDVIVMIIRMLENYEDFELEYEDVEEVFEDVYKKDYFYNSIVKAKKLGIAKGDGKYFNPNKPVTVQEVILLIDRAGDLLGLDIDDDMIKELEGIYEGELDKSAKRRDVFWMLYYVLDMVEYDDSEEDESINDDFELDTIKYTLSENSDKFYLVTKDFVNVYEEVEEETGNDLEYIKFKSGNESLMYDDSTRDVVVNKTNKYYAIEGKDRDVSDIYYERKDDFAKILEIEYLAFDEDDKAYPGLIKITVNGKETLEDLKYQLRVNNTLELKESHFEGSIDRIKFVLPDVNKGKLYYNDQLVKDNDVFDDDELDDISFKPAKDYTGEVIINYYAYDGSDTDLGRIILNVYKAENVIDRISIEMDEDIEDDFIIDFSDELYDKVGRNIYNDFSYVNFEYPSEGEFSIKYDGDIDEIEEDYDYLLEDVEYLIYEPEDDGVININYTVFDSDDVPYEGVIRITINE